jgi:LysM repeat protein
MEWTDPFRGWQVAPVAILALVVTSLSWQEGVVSLSGAALDSLREHRAVTVEPHTADRPAMDLSLPSAVTPPDAGASASDGRQVRPPVQPFEYEVRQGETLQDLATRFGTDVSALLQNNHLDSPDQVKVGTRLTILPVRGVLHRVQEGETLQAIADRFASRLDDLIVANALRAADSIVPGQLIVITGGSGAMSGGRTDPRPGSMSRSVIVPVATVTVLTAAPHANELPLPPGVARYQREFILSVAPGARESQRKTGVPASVTLAQAILESDWGRSKLTREANNLFGIKAQNGPGSAGTYEINTDEVDDGEIITVMAAFKAYTSLADSIVDHGRWFHENSRYRKALEVKNDPRAFAYAINAAGYATDPDYAPKLIDLMDRFNLYAYDLQQNG